MSSPSKTPLRAVFTAGRSRWWWLGVAGVLGVWLITLLVMTERERPPVLPPAAAARLPRFEAKTVDAFTRRHAVRASRPSAVPFRVNDGVDDGKSK